jgi:hypothetical protein
MDRFAWIVMTGPMIFVIFVVKKGKLSLEMIARQFAANVTFHPPINVQSAAILSRWRKKSRRNVIPATAGSEIAQIKKTNPAEGFF